MIAFGHTAVGSLVGLAGYSYFGQTDPGLGLTLTAGSGIISHYLADLIPHGHFFRGNQFKDKIIWAIIFDLGLSIGLFLFLAYLKFGLTLPFYYIVAGIAGSQFPDILDGLIYAGFFSKKGFLKSEHQLHVAVHWHGIKEKTLLLGWIDIWQLSLILITLLILLK